MIGKIRLLFWMGVVMLFIPYIGIHEAWKHVLIVLFAIVIILVSFRLRKDYKGLRFRLRRFEKIEEKVEAQVAEPVIPVQEAVKETADETIEETIHG